MTPEQEAHLAGLIDWVSTNLDAKYRAGQQEHGGSMWLKPGMLRHLMEESWDFLSYLYTLSEQIRKKDPTLYSVLMSPDQLTDPRDARDAG